MKKEKYLDKNEMELAKSLETEEWISDLTKKEKKQFWNSEVETIIDEKFEQSLQLFEQEKLFLNPKFSLNDLVLEMNANRTIVSNYINRFLNQ